MKTKNKNFVFEPLDKNKFNNSKEEFIKFLSKEYFNVQKKLFKSKFLFIFLNLASFLISTTIVILTLVIIGKKIGTSQVVSIFVSISIISAIISFITGVSTLFQFKKRKIIYQNKIQKLHEIINSLKESTNDINQDIKTISDTMFDLNNDVI